MIAYMWWHNHLFVQRVGQREAQHYLTAQHYLAPIPMCTITRSETTTRALVNPDHRGSWSVYRIRLERAP